MHKPETLTAKHPDGRIITFDDYVKEGDQVTVFEWFDDVHEANDGGNMSSEIMIVMHSFDDGWFLRELTDEEREERNERILNGKK